MPNYLTKEEIRQWRSSLEKITLEEFAARLGKTVEESKPTNDVVDVRFGGFCFYGTGSYPWPPQGWQRRILLTVR